MSTRFQPRPAAGRPTPAASAARDAPGRRGFTLIELLVVIAIISIMIALAIPLVRPLLDNRKIRETAREVNAYFVGAQARAAELQRPVGVWIQRRGYTSPQAAESFQLFMAETPPPYVGFWEGETCMIQPIPGSNNGYNYATSGSPLPPAPSAASPNPLWLSDAWEGMAVFPNDILLNTVVSPGDTIKFNYIGRLYRIRRIIVNAAATPPSTAVFFTHLLPGGQSPVGVDVATTPLPATSLPSAPMRFQIFLHERKSSVGSLTLPESTTIDLTVSGIGLGAQSNAFAAPLPPATSGPIVIMFSPTGGIDRVWVNGTAFVPQGPVYLLVADAEKVEPTNPTSSNANLLELANQWVAINNRTGEVGVFENFNSASAAPNLSAMIQMARTYAVSGQTIGGN